jgi:hypothetical protein
MCEITGSLPQPGGLFQQRASHIKRMQAVFRAREAHNTEEHKRMEREAKRN